MTLPIQRGFQGSYAGPLLGGRFQVLEHIVQRETYNIVDLTKFSDGLAKDAEAFLRTVRGELLSFETMEGAADYAIDKSALYSQKDLSLVSDRAEERDVTKGKVYNYRSIPSEGLPSVILIGSNVENNQAWFLTLTPPGHPEHPKVDRIVTTIKDFQTRFVETNEDTSELAQLLREHGRHLGITAMGATELRRFLPVNNQEIFNVGTKKSETAATEAPKTKPEKVKPAATPKATKPAAAPKAEKTKPAPAAKETKTAAPKADKPAKAPAAPKEPKPARPSVSARFCELIMEGKKTDDEIFAAVQKEFGLSDEKRSYVSWNRNNLIKKGKNPPPPVGGAAKPGPKAKK